MKKLIKRFKSLICRVRGCDYPAPAIDLRALYHCRRCGKEICGRTFADLEPIPADELDSFMMNCELDCHE